MLNFLRFQTRVLHCGQRPSSKLLASAGTPALEIANKELSLDMMQKDYMDRFNLHLGRRGVESRKEVFAGLLRTQERDSRRRGVEQ
jgi:predicted secreted protein